MGNHPFQILALHGFTGCGEDFLYLDTATPSKWHWHCPDLPGHGPAPQLDCRPTATQAFIARNCSKRQTSDAPNVLLGYSMGARAALQHAVLYPDQWDALILISGHPGIEIEDERTARRRSDAELADRIERDGVHAFLDFWQQTPMIRSQQNICSEWRETMQANRFKHTASGLASSLRQFGQGSCPNLWPKLHQLTMPILLITGEQDRKYTTIAQRMRQLLPQATHNTIPNVGHMPQLESPKVTLEAIQTFLTALT